MPGVQSPTRRLLTEQAGADRYLPLTSRGVANGVPTLDATGRIPATQMPLAGSVPIVSRLTAPFTVPATTADVTGLALTGLVPGTWEIQLDGMVTTTSSGTSVVTGYLVPGSGLVAAASAVSAGASSYVRRVYSTGVLTSFSWAADGSTALALNTSATPSFFQLNMTMVITSGGTLQVRAGGGTGWFLTQHTTIRASKVA